MAVRTPLNAAHVQLNKKLGMDDFLTSLTFLEGGAFLKNN